MLCSNCTLASQVPIAGGLHFAPEQQRANREQIQKASGAPQRKGQGIRKVDVEECSACVATNPHSGPSDQHHLSQCTTEALGRNRILDAEDKTRHVAGKAEAEDGRQQEERAAVTKPRIGPYTNGLYGGG